MTGLARDMVHSVEQCLGNRDEAIRSVRAVLRHFGGQLVYIPMAREHGEGGKHIEQLRDVLAEEIGGGEADRFVQGWTRSWGGAQMYMPLEHTAFRDEIADDIYARYDGTMTSMADLCREYRMSYVNVYRLFHKGKARKLAKGQKDLFDSLD